MDAAELYMKFSDLIEMVKSTTEEVIAENDECPEGAEWSAMGNRCELSGERQSGAGYSATMESLKKIVKEEFEAEQKNLSLGKRADQLVRELGKQHGPEDVVEILANAVMIAKSMSSGSDGYEPTGKEKDSFMAPGNYEPQTPRGKINLSGGKDNEG